MEPMHEAREAYLTHLQQLLQDNPPEGRDELEYVREQLAQLDADGVCDPGKSPWRCQLSLNTGGPR